MHSLHVTCIYTFTVYLFLILLGEDGCGLPEQRGAGGAELVAHVVDGRDDERVQRLQLRAALGRRHLGLGRPGAGEHGPAGDQRRYSVMESISEDAVTHL